MTLYTPKELLAAMIVSLLVFVPVVVCFEAILSTAIEDAE